MLLGVMSRFYLKLTVMMALLLVIMTWAMRGIGAAQPGKVELAGFSVGCSDKPQPCWHGIVPEVTSLAEAERILLEAGYSADPTREQTYLRPGDQCPVVMNRDRVWVKRLILNLSCSPLQLGDMMASFGVPDGIGAWRLFFGAGSIQAVVANQPELAAQNQCMDFSPLGRTTALVLQNPHVVTSNTEPIMWRGALTYLFYVKRYSAWTCYALMNAPY